MDAYQTLASVIREYDVIPEEAVLKNKINVLLQYIKRDLLRQVKPDEPQIADTNVITQALKVLVIFVWKRDYASLLSDEYRTFILDRSIQVLTEHTAPKSVIIHYLHLLATQDFRSTLITSNNRVGRLLETLKVLTEHVKGNGAVSERLLVYQKLLDQAKPVMKAKAGLWVEELLTGMTSSLKDIRIKAMMLGTKTCSAFPASSSISVSVRSILGRELEPSRSLSSVMCRKLEKMLASKEEALQAPQIWAIVLLLSNGADARIDSWSELKDWLKVVQRCFNCSESAIRQQANKAWNRFVYVVRPHDASETLMAMLAKPLTAQLERQTMEKTVKSSRSTAMSSYCNLLYYAFRPAASHKQYTRVWNEYIVKVMKNAFFEKNSANSDLCCRVFIALLWNANTSTKVWNENRALENTPIEPEELPTIDCKWIRSRSAAIIDMFQVLLRYSSWGASGESDRAYIAVAWTHFLKAIRDSCSKEIKPSLETKHAVTGVVDFLGQRWTDFLREGDDPHGVGQALSYAQIRQMTRIAVHELDHMLVLTGVESGSDVLCKTPVVLEMFDSVASGLRQLDNGEMRSHLQTPRNTLQALLSQYEKCLELLNSLVIREFQSETTSSPTTVGLHLDMLHRILERAPEDQQIETVALLSTALVTLVKDESHRINVTDDSNCSRAYRKLCSTVIKLPFKGPPTAVQLLDTLFAAPFESSHACVVNEALNTWMHKSSQYEQITPGPYLSKALLQLENVVDREDLDRLGTADGPIDIVEPKPAILKGSSTPVSSRLASVNLDDMESVGDASPILGSQVGGHMEAESPDGIVSSPERPVSRPRSRHDDSQVHFVAIESSPPVRDEPESQHLTARQKEVRQRQRSEPAVVFPDLRSSPRHSNKSQSQSDCEFARKAAAQEERPSTPTLPAHHDQGDAEIMASPTPRARHSTKQITDIEVPSSPPSMLDHQGKETDRSEITSSPPQRPTEDADIGIDLAIPQPVGPSDGVVEEEDQLHCQDRAEVVDDATENAEAEGNQEPGYPHAEKSDEVLRDTQEADFAPSIVQETMTTSDENGSDDHHSLAENPKTDSDEIDMLSASQLSQDLDRHLSQTVEENVHHDLIEDVGAQRLRDDVNPQPVDAVPRKTRKRKYSGVTTSSSKRRRAKRSSQSSSLSLSSELSPTSNSQMNEMLDTIEVLAPEQDQSVVVRDFAGETLSGPAEPEHPPKRRRGRPRKNVRNSQSQEQAKPAVEVIVDTHASEAVHLQGETDVEQPEVDIDLPEDKTRTLDDQAVETEPPPVAEVEAADAMEDVLVGTEDVTAEVFTQVDKADRNVQPGIVASLQSILDRLKTTNMEKIDLRAVDDLCFQIRYQAQAITQQRAE